MPGGENECRMRTNGERVGCTKWVFLQRRTQGTRIIHTCGQYSSQGRHDTEDTDLLINLWGRRSKGNDQGSHKWRSSQTTYLHPMVAEGQTLRGNLPRRGAQPCLLALELLREVLNP